MSGGPLTGIAVLRRGSVALGIGEEEQHVVAWLPVQRRPDDGVGFVDGAVRLQIADVQVAALDGVQCGLVAALLAASEQIAGRAIVTVGAQGVQDDALVAAGVVTAQRLQP